MRKLILKNIDELVTCRGYAPKSGKDMMEIDIIKDGCILTCDDRIEFVGTTIEAAFKYDFNIGEVIDCTGSAVIPGFVDSHTHFIFGGYRADEFALRLQGASYMDIMKIGGGILNTVRKTRAAAKEELIALGNERLDSMLHFGVTTVEGKSGYGLDLETEIKQLEVMKYLNDTHMVDVVSTFLGPHSIADEYKGRADEFIDYIINDVMPVVKEKKLAEFADIFCEKGVFDIEQSKTYFKAAGDMGFSLKIHADEIVQLGGAELAAEMGAKSADHLLNVSEKGIDDMAEKGTIATLLPATAFSLKEKYANARHMIDRGCAVALATDYNPGSCPTNSIPLVIALAALYMNMRIEEIITALTINGAAAIGRENEIGSIQAGKKADILILKYPSINYLPYNIGINIVKSVIKNGQIINN